MKRRSGRFLREIAPEDIFLDSSNVSEFDTVQFEGRIATALPRRLYTGLSLALVVLGAILIGRAWYLQGIEGARFAKRSAQNMLSAVTLFAPRGVITDVHGIVLAENVADTATQQVTRSYPVSSLSHVLGYVSYPKKDARGVYYETHETGLAGIEAEYDAILAGENGQLLVETDALGAVRSQGSIVPSVEGRTIALSIDSRVQEALDDAVRSTAQAHHFIAGAGVIMDVTTGGIQALVSYPSYDSNVMARGGPKKTIDAYADDPGRPFLDHVVQGVYVPGSIVKPLVAAGALTDGIISGQTTITDSGKISIPDPYHPGNSFVYTGWKALGPVAVRKAIAWSSDIFFYTIGGGFENQKGLGIDRLAYWYRAFGLGSTTGIGLSGEARGLIPTPSWKSETLREPWYLGDTYFTAIGQYALQVTPIQMVRAIAAVANGGTLYTPTLLRDAPPRSSVSVPVDAAQLVIVREGMRQAVTSALAGALNLPYVSVAAKTGTAQTGTRNQYDNSWVVGFFPYDKPQYAFAVVLERGPQGAGEQSVNVMAKFFDTLHKANSPYVGGTSTSTTLAL